MSTYNEILKSVCVLFFRTCDFGKVTHIEGANGLAHISHVTRRLDNRVLIKTVRLVLIFSSQSIFHRGLLTWALASVKVDAICVVKVLRAA